jgi:hypothetical protein
MNGCAFSMIRYIMKFALVATLGQQLIVSACIHFILNSEQYLL